MTIADPPLATVTNVDTDSNSASPTARERISRLLVPLVHNALFPGNSGHLDYRRLGHGRDELPGEHITITSAVGSHVGLHIYPSNTGTDTLVVIFCHGNIQPTRYLPHILLSLLDCGVTVVGRDFVGYDRSSRVPNVGGALEVASIANDKAVVEWVTVKYPNAQIIICGRSIGTFGWTNGLGHPKVIGAIGIVPFAQPIKAIERSIKNTVPLVSTLVSTTGLPQSITSAAFPVGVRSTLDPSIITHGFAAHHVRSAEIRGKAVVLYPAASDELVPKEEVDVLKQALEQGGCHVFVTWLDGDHRSLPTNAMLKEGIEAILNVRSEH